MLDVQTLITQRDNVEQRFNKNAQVITDLQAEQLKLQGEYRALGALIDSQQKAGDKEENTQADVVEPVQETTQDA